MTTRFLLVRHAAHDLAGRALAGRMPGLGLNAQGHRQAQRLAEALQPHGVHAIHSSPQRRTRETAQPVAERLGLPVALAPELDEIDFGAWTGRSIAELDAEAAPAWRLWNTRRAEAVVPGGEAFADVARRAAAGVERLRRAHEGQTVLVVSHADVLKAVVATHLGLPLEQLDRFEIACASLTILQAGEGWSQLTLLNAPLA